MAQQAVGSEIRRRARTPSPALRRSLLRLQRRQCLYSGEDLARKKLSSDHVIPLSRGGSPDLSNILICSQQINCDKNGHLPGVGIVDTWLQHLRQHASALQTAASRHDQNIDIAGSIHSALAAYRNVQAGEVLWNGPAGTSPASREDLAHIIRMLAQQ